MRGKKHRFGMAVALGSLMLSIGFGSTLTFAGTEKIQVKNTTESIAPEEDLAFKSDMFTATENDGFFSLSDTTLPYDTFFTDEDGNIFPCDDCQPRALCIHSYVNGTVTAHKKIDKGCRVNYFNAKRCRICGSTVIYDLYKTENWVTCPH